MARILLLAAASLLASPAAAAEEAAFKPSPLTFPDAAACRAQLSGIVSSAQGYDVVRGPYDLAAGDVRIHLVRAEDTGHHIWEHRCLAEVLSSRDWVHRMEQTEEAFTVESAARKAEWLKKEAPKK